MGEVTGFTVACHAWWDGLTRMCGACGRNSNGKACGAVGETVVGQLEAPRGYDQMHGASLDIITWKQATGWVVMAPRGKLGSETGRARQDTPTRAQHVQVCRERAREKGGGRDGGPDRHTPGVEEEVCGAVDRRLLHLGHALSHSPRQTLLYSVHSPPSSTP